jgi:FlaA1/EpsC-like NDP-sugar epimerase
VQLVLDAGTMGRGREVFVLNMGEPVSIYELACTMIRLSGLQPEKDIPIQITGLRDGEKLFEEISLDTECVEQTDNDRIFILKDRVPDSLWIENALKKLFVIIQKRQDEKLYTAVKSLVPTFSDERFNTDNVVSMRRPAVAEQAEK